MSGRCTVDAERDHFVYRLFDRRGALLYIGCTSNFRNRWYDLRAEWMWMRKATAVRMVGPLPKSDAYELEARLIAEERPPHNMKSGWRPATIQRYRETAHGIG